MFQRRLALLLALLAVAMLALAAKTMHLTVVRGADLRAQAESRLVRHVWTPTVRGKILDRKGRVLARDRAGYDLGIDFTVLSGEWARERAKAFVKSAYREQWTSLPEDHRRQLIELARDSYEAHARASRDELAALAGMSRTELDSRLDEIVSSVRRMGDAQRRRSRDKELKEAGERDEIVTPELLAAIERRADQPIREERTAHKLAARLTDDAAFRAQFLLGEETEIRPIPGETGARSFDRVSRLPGVRLFDAGEREYPMERIAVEIDRSTFPSVMADRSPLRVQADGVGAHVLGWMRDEATGEDAAIRKEYLEANPKARKDAVIAAEVDLDVDRGEYRLGDRAGASGLERGREPELRGLRGYTTRQIDTGAVSSIEARPGRDIITSIDIILQARVQAIMSPEFGLATVQPWHRGPTEPVNPTMPDGTPINGAAVVLDIDSGEILAMVSMPEFRREDLLDRQAGDMAMNDPVAAPFLNRCIDRPYPPGSIVKPLVLTGAVTRGAHRLEDTIACNGHLLPNNENMYRCWIFKRSQQDKRLTHSKFFGHDLEPSEAIMVSCNVYFFTLGKKLGFEGITDVFRTFGLGSTWNLGIGEEFAGHLGRTRATPTELQGDAIQMGIGQGPVSWTPLHAAAAYATLARYGYVVPPTILKGEGSREPRDLKLDARATSAAIEGLRRSVNERSGTGNHLSLADGVTEPIFNAPNVDIWGKTGTAQAPRIYAPSPRPPAVSDEPVDSDGENPTPPTPAPPRELLREGDHSWFVVLVGPKGDRPRYAIAVMMEYAGSGGKISGPICNQIIHALIAEGYL